MTEFKKTTVKINAKDIIAISGYEYEYALADGKYVPMHVCKYDGSWKVIDPKTGRYLTTGSKTREDAVKLADSMEVKPTFSNFVGSAKYGKFILEFERKCGIERKEEAEEKPAAKKPTAKKPAAKKQTAKTTAKKPKAPKPHAKKSAPKKVTVKKGESELIDALMELEQLKKELADLKAGILNAEQEKAAKEIADKALADMAEESTVVTLESMRKWCEGKGLRAEQTHPGSNDKIWILGESRDYKGELEEMGFRWAKKSKRYGRGWWRVPTNA